MAQWLRELTGCFFLCPLCPSAPASDGITGMHYHTPPIFIFYLYVCACACVSVRHMYVGVHRGQKMDPLKLELQGVVSQPPNVYAGNPTEVLWNSSKHS